MESDGEQLNRESSPPPLSCSNVGGVGDMQIYKSKALFITLDTIPFEEVVLLSFGP